MPDFRVHCPSVAPDAAEIRLGPEESHHLVTVNRCSRGDVVVAFDGHGQEWITECVEPSKGATLLHVKQFRPARPLAHRITLAQALPKGATMEEIVRQATEVGAARIVPLLSERSQVHLDDSRAEKKVEKWRTTAIEAAKQCGNPWLPEIAPVQTFKDFVGAPDEVELKLIASLHAGSTSLKAALKQYGTRHPGQTAKKAVWLIGPEGDFSPEEMTVALSAGFQPITLGPLVLRSDTAALYALSVLSHELQSR